MKSHRGNHVAGRGAAERETNAESGKTDKGSAAHVDTSPLDGLIGYALRRAQLAVFDEAIRAFAALDLRPAQYSVLTLIGTTPGLERRGLARRGDAPNDRRSHALHLTEKGERVLRRANGVVAVIEERLDAKLGPGGRAQLLDLLKRLTV